MTYYIAYYLSIRRQSRSPIPFPRCNLCAVPWHRPIRQHEATVSHQPFRPHLLPENAGFPVIITSNAQYQTMGSRGTAEADWSLSAHRACSDEEDQNSAGADHGENNYLRIIEIPKIYGSRQREGIHDDESHPRCMDDEWSSLSLQFQRPSARDRLQEERLFMLSIKNQKDWSVYFRFLLSPRGCTVNILRLSQQMNSSHST